MQPSLNPALAEFWRTPARNRVLVGGRASSKSWDAAGVAIAIAQDVTARFLCVRQFQNKIAESVYTLLKIQAERFGLYDDFKFTDNSIINYETGSEFLFYGIARNLDEIKSTENVDILWIEEGHLLTAEQWRILEPTIRKEGSQVWLLFNPRFATDFAYQRFVVNPPPNTIVRLINYPENPFLSKTMLDIIEAAKLEDYEEYEHVYLGVPREDSDKVIIKRQWIEAAIDAHVKLGMELALGEKRIGFDVADDGADKCANVFAHGAVALWLEEWKGQEDQLLASCSRTYNNAIRLGASIRYDSIGVGAGCGAKFNELNYGREFKVKHSKFNAGDAVFDPDGWYQPTIRNKDQFSNLKAQTWWLVADRFRNTYNAVKNGMNFAPDQLISIASDMPKLEQLKTELSTPYRDFDQNGRVKVESKKDLAKRNILSPNLADAFVMCYAPGVKRLNINKDTLNRMRR